MNLVNWLFGCNCKRFSFPLTTRGRRLCAAAAVTGTYVVCLDCGAEYPYDWRRMRVLEMPKEKEVERQILPLINADGH